MPEAYYHITKRGDSYVPHVVTESGARLELTRVIMTDIALLCATLARANPGRQIYFDDAARLDFLNAIQNHPMYHYVYTK